MKVTESVRYQELKGVVYPLISIDEFEPKTGKESEVIVVSLYCKEEEAAMDLRDFLEKGVTETLDIDTSPSSDEHGRYLVFVELKRNQNFWNDLERIVADTTRLSGKMDWKIITYLNSKGFAMDDPELKNYVILDPKKYMTKEDFQSQVKGSLSTFFKDSEVDQAEVAEGMLNIRSGYHQMSFLYEGISDTSDYTGGFEMKNVPSEITSLQKLLGNQFSVNFKTDKIYVENLTNGNVLILKRYE